MNDAPRRRRIDSDEPPRGGGGLPIFPLILVVVFAGLLLGGVLAHFFGRTPPSSTVAVASASPTPEQTATFAAAETSRPSPSPSPSATPSPAAQPTPTKKPLAVPSPTATPVASAKPAATPTELVRIITPAPRTSPAPVVLKHTQPVAIAHPVETQVPAVEPGVAGIDRATAIVRSYLSALARGDQSSATSYLQSGLPSETFMNGAKITAIRASQTDSAHYKVSANISSPGGEYFETFVVEPGPQGLVITDHTAIKP